MKRINADAKEARDDGLPALFGRLAEDTTTLLDAKLELLKIELKEEANAYIRGTVMLIIGAVVALIGFGLLNVAIAFLISTLFNNTDLSQPARYGVGFLITALLYLVAGGVVIVINKNRIAEQDIVPKRSVAELKRDKAAIEGEL